MVEHNRKAASMAKELLRRDPKHGPSSTKRSARALESRRTRGIQSYRCRVCRGIHPLRKCARFLKLSAEKRLRAVLINKYCAICLAHEHSTGDCRSGDRCKKCDRSHHTLLHMHEQVSSLSRSRASYHFQCSPADFPYYAYAINRDSEQHQHTQLTEVCETGTERSTCGTM
nr:uncharacterized protein LOC120284376 isoform X2 [Drosophila simulans]XP_039147612.1 uncharacterized protein LOC120284376 isoform X3 [Drosophila simulans]